MCDTRTSCSQRNRFWIQSTVLDCNIMSCAWHLPAASRELTILGQVAEFKREAPSGYAYLRSSHGSTNGAYITVKTMEGK